MTKKRRKKSQAFIIRYLLRKGFSPKEIAEATPFSQTYVYIVKHLQRTDKIKKKGKQQRNGEKLPRLQKTQMKKTKAY